MINGDESRVIAFDPTDILFAERFYKAIADFEAKLADYQKRAQDLEAESGEDANGIPTNTEARIALLRDTCQFMRDKIDSVFGAGTSQTTFGDALSLDMFNQFFDGITPYFSKARAAKVAQYIPQSRKPVNRTGRKSKRM